MKTIASSAQIALSAIICDNVIIGDNVVIEENVFIDVGCIIRDNVHIGKGTRVGARCILGEYLQDFYEELNCKPHPLYIGTNALIRSETIIYGDCVIGDYFQTGHRVTIREHSKIGHHVRVGTLSDIQGYCQIGNYVNLHSNVHIGQTSIIHDYVWLFPYVVLTNDPCPPSMDMRGVEVDSFAVIATSTVVLPGIHIGQDSLIGAGSVVTKDIPMETVAFGSPAKLHGSIHDVKNPATDQSAYPWRKHFDRGMPWEGVGYDAWSKTREEELREN